MHRLFCFQMIRSLATYFEACEWEFNEDEGAVVRPSSDLFPPNESNAASNIALSGRRKCLKNKRVKQECANFPEM